MCLSSLARASNYLICIFMNINEIENLKNKEKIVKNIINNISNPNHHQTTIVAIFISPVIQFDKYFHHMFLYGNYLICIFVNVTGNLEKMRTKPLHKLES